MLGILCGLESEAKIARQIGGALVACAAARPGKARELARGLVAQGATKLMSFGIAGALDSSAHLGDVFIGTRVSSKSGDWLCDEKWGNALMAKIPQAQRGGVFGSEYLVATVADKGGLYRDSGCVIVDMESQCAAEVAAAYNIPLSVVRAICDDASMNVPPLVMATIAEDGSINVTRGLSHLAKHPTDIIDLFHMLKGTNKALNALKKTSVEL
jgi:hopanoid-associated phosphorylase